MRSADEQHRAAPVRSDERGGETCAEGRCDGKQCDGNGWESCAAMGRQEAQRRCKAKTNSRKGCSVSLDRSQLAIKPPLPGVAKTPWAFEERMKGEV